MEDERTITELLDLLHAIARWFFGLFDQGGLPVADGMLDELLCQILRSDRIQETIHEFRDRGGGDRCEFCKNFCRFHTHDYVLRTYARHLAERAVASHFSLTGSPALDRHVEELPPAKRRSRATRRWIERTRSELHDFQPKQYLIWSLLALALAGIEDSEDHLLVLIGRSIRLIGMRREEIFEEAALLVGEPAASIFRAYASQAPRETARRVYELGYREIRDGRSIRYQYDAARMSEGWL